MKDDRCGINSFSNRQPFVKMDMNTACLLDWCLGALLLTTGSTFALPAPAPEASGGQALAADSIVGATAPIDISADGELLLLFLPGGQGFELVNTRTGERSAVSATPNTGYFASVSPDKRYVCFKEFLSAGGERLQVPALYDIAEKRVVRLAQPAPAAGNPVVSSRGQIAYTVGSQLTVLNADLGRFTEMSLGVVVNVLVFSPDGGQLAFSSPDESISWIDLDSGHRGNAPAGSLRGYRPQFSPDGQSLLARSSNGEIRGWHRANGTCRNFGPAETAAWLDADTVALVRKDVAQFVVAQTRVEKHRLADGAASTLLFREGDAGVAIKAKAIAIVEAGTVSLADASTGVSRQVALPPVPVTIPQSEAETPASSKITPLNVVTNTTTVQLTGVPYVNQVYDTDPAFPGGSSACNATATIMAIQYYNRLPPRPITCTQGGTHTSYYGFYISSKYSYNGHVFDIASADWGLEGYYGGFGYFLQDGGGSSLKHSSRLKEYITYHGLTSATDDSTSFAKAQAEIDANHPVVVLNSLTSAGHYITCIGYLRAQHTLIFNDPYGNKNVSYPGKAGAGVYYDWPGYNNGYQNLNTVWRYVYARGTANANTNWGSYWDLNGAAPGAGATPGGTWDSTSTNWSSSANGTVATGPWAGQNACFAAGTDATGSYAIRVSNTQMVANLFVQKGTVTFNGGRFYFLGAGTYFSNYVDAGATAVFNTPFGGTAAPDKWGPGTAVYNGASTCAGYFSHNDGTLALGNNSALSTVRLEVGDVSGTKVVTLKSADATARTLANYLVLNATSLNVGAGGNLTFTGPVNVNVNAKPARTIAVSNSVTTLSGMLTNTCGITKTGLGTLVFSGATANTYGSSSANGHTTVSGGTLKLGKPAGVNAVANGSLIVSSGGTLLLGAANQVANALPMTLAGGTFQTAGFAEQVGPLKLTGNSVIDLGAGSSVLGFAASSGVAWTAGARLTLTNWNGSIRGSDAARVVFGGNDAGLSATQVSQLRFANPAGFAAGVYPATILATGEVVPFAATALYGASSATGGQLQFNLAGATGGSYAILASTNLTHWAVLQITNSPCTFTDTNTSGFPQRFYRAQYLP